MLHHLHSINDDKMKSSWNYFAKVKILNVSEEVSWQNHKRTSKVNSWYWNFIVIVIVIFFISSLSACSLWLWHCLNVVCMLSYM